MTVSNISDAYKQPTLVVFPSCVRQCNWVASASGAYILMGKYSTAAEVPVCANHQYVTLEHNFLGIPNS